MADGDKVCPLKFGILARGPLTKSEVRCEYDLCAWWDEDMKTCCVAVIGQFMKPLHADGLAIQAAITGIGRKG